MTNYSYTESMATERPSDSLPTSISNSPRDATVAFGGLLRDYRERMNLSQRTLAGIVDVDDSTIARIEAGTQKPPRDISFYERLRQVPELTEPEIAALLKTDDAPRWLVGDRDADNKRSNTTLRSTMAVEGGVQINLLVHANPDEFTEDELEAMKEILRIDLELCLGDFLRHRDRL